MISEECFQYQGKTFEELRSRDGYETLARENEAFALPQLWSQQQATKEFGYIIFRALNKDLVALNQGTSI